MMASAWIFNEYLTTLGLIPYVVASKVIKMVSPLSSLAFNIIRNLDYESET